ncbi:putative O-glycosylation ligase, exosortase A system-associated [Rhodopila sp.]|uniref:putative O-glycosylation ligase, exosortase A system-associated n=1 Tax=Rhodopila sp. TaxID=2480087 RepID=UPI003D0AAA50
MLRSLWLLFLYTSFLGLGVNAPFVATLGYVWVDTFQPQAISYIILNQLPVAMIMGAAAFGLYLLLDRRSPPRLSLETILQVAMGIWVTLTIIWAAVPDAAWEKWDWAFKTVMFAAFLPYVIRSRVQIEAFAQTYVFSLAANFVPFGLKTLISGGGYGSNLGLQAGNSGLAEGGLLSTVGLMAVPLAIYLGSHSQLMPRLKLMPLAYWAIAGLAVVTAIGTFERSALIGLVVLFAYMWMRSRHKLRLGVVGCLGACLLVYSTSSAWDARIETIGHFENENSAYVRILVWKWTLGYVAEHPFGGGFQAYLTDHIEVPGVDNEPGFTEFGRAFHSIYFEVLGEQGYPGLLMFLALAGVTFVRLHRAAKRAREDPELRWVVALSDALQAGLAVFLTSGAFVGIAFQPMFWYFISMGISLNAYMWRVEHSPSSPVVGWRATATSPSTEAISPPSAGGWRSRPAIPFVKVAAPKR